MLGDESNFFASKSRKIFRKMQIFLRTKENLGIYPAPGIQEPRWPLASKDLCTPLTSINSMVYTFLAQTVSTRTTDQTDYISN